MDAPLLDTDEVRDALQQAADALPEPLHVQVPKPCNRVKVRVLDNTEVVILAPWHLAMEKDLNSPLALVTSLCPFCDLAKGRQRNL